MLNFHLIPSLKEDPSSWETDVYFACNACGGKKIPFHKVDDHRNWHGRNNLLFRLRARERNRTPNSSEGTTQLSCQLTKLQCPDKTWETKWEQAEIEEYLETFEATTEMSYVDGHKYHVGNMRGKQGPNFINLDLSHANINNTKEKAYPQSLTGPGTYFQLECKEGSFWVCSKVPVADGVALSVNGIALEGPATEPRTTNRDVEEGDAMLPSSIKLESGDIITVASSGSKNVGFCDLLFALVSETKSHPRSKKKKVDPEPSTLCYPGWMILITLCVLYNAWTLPLRQSIKEIQAEYQTFWIIVDLATDACLVLDIIVQCCRKPYGCCGPQWFCLDILTVLPTDLLQLWLGVNPMIRFPRFVKVYRVYNYWSLNPFKIFSRHPLSSCIAYLTHNVLLLSHWFGCGYSTLSELLPWYHLGDPSPTSYTDFAPLWRKYMASLYWGVTVLTSNIVVSHPSHGWQYLFTILAQMTNFFVFATVVGTIVSVLIGKRGQPSSESVQK